MKINKKVFFGICFIIILICIFIFAKNIYKKSSFGNTNIGNSKEEVLKNILNINSYTAKIEVSVTSNKNENKYVLSQEYTAPNTAKQTVIEPSNIEGLTICNEGNKLTINNTRLNLSKIYENYNYITEDHLFLNTFIENFKNCEESKVEENENEIILKTHIKNDNKYMANKILYVDKQSKKISKMKIEDLNQNAIVYIVYNEITTNSSK